jgi:hypothetical protein
MDPEIRRTIERLRREFATLGAERSDLAKIAQYLRGEAQRVKRDFRAVLDAGRQQRGG